MDVRGPDRHDASNNLSQVRGELLRYEPADDANNSKTHPFIAHTTTPALDRLIQELKALPEVREDLVAKTVTKLRDGQLSTRKSAEETAQAILSTLNEE